MPESPQNSGEKQDADSVAQAEQVRAEGTLSEPHRTALEQESGITPEVINARGYKTVKTKAELAKVGFSRSQQIVPALLVPIYDVTGKLATHQVRPDEPRTVKTKGSDQKRVLKYETPEDSRLSLDVNPLSRKKLGDPSTPLYVTEGSKKVDALVSRGVCALGLMGVWGWRGGNDFGGTTALADWENVALNGRLVYLVFDSDVMTKPEVFKALARLKTLLESRKARVKIIYLPDHGGAKVGVDDYLVQGHSVANLLTLAADELRSPPSYTTTDATPVQAWPELDDAALYGPAGKVVGLIRPHTEADDAAILFQTLAYYGVAVGSSPYYQVEGDKHHANLFLVVAGNSAKGRKGTSQGRVRQVMDVADPTLTDRTESGLSSGEGLIWAVRDAVGDNDTTAPTDKRLLISEGELAQALKVMKREGNTLSVVVRNAWDERPLQSLTRNSPVKATGAHVGIIGHITDVELRRHLDATELSNGFANRFLYVCVRRSKVLPFGGNLDDKALTALGSEIGKALAQARTFERVTMDAEAKEVWREVYPELSEGKPGLFGSVIARSEAQALRLALIYALLDASRVITRDHLEAGLACWDYCEASARYLFGAKLGDPTADSILAALREANGKGMSRTQISNHLGRHASSSQLDRALGELRAAHLVSSESKDTGGRPSEVWRVR